MKRIGWIFAAGLGLLGLGAAISQLVDPSSETHDAWRRRRSGSEQQEDKDGLHYELLAA